MFLCIFKGLLQLNTCNFDCLLFQLLTIFISVISNFDKAGFLEYPNRYLNWVPQFVLNVFNGPFNSLSIEVPI